MTGLLEHIIASENSSIERFMKFYEDMFDKQILERTELFDKTKNKVKLLPDEKADAKKEKKKIKEAKQNRAKAEAGGSMADLEKMILAKRDNAFGGFVNYMEEKYGGASAEVDWDDENQEPNMSKKRTKPTNDKAKKGGTNKKKKIN